MSDSKFVNNIYNEFRKKSFSELYNNDIWIAIILITLVIIVAIYFYILNTIKSQKANWKNNKCNPFFMPFASTINEENSDISYNQKNFEECLNELNYDMSVDIKRPISSIFSVFLGIFSVLSKGVSKFISFILYIMNFLMRMFALIIQRLKKLLSSVNGIFIFIFDFLKSIFSVLRSAYYMAIIMVESIKYMFTVVAMSYLIMAVLPTLVAFTLWGVLLVVFTLLYAIIGPFFGWWVLPPLYTSVAGYIITYILFILLFLLYVVLISFAIGVIAKQRSL